ncbi:MAG TPA: class I SAM-dependent RNA methyltransferase [Pyrinomonadaceae bacterium]|nr:class I SAM-dependent RNA methyltransferase [Pyrinomonadaceae bacterium]
MYNIDDILEVEIVKIVPGGYGLAFGEKVTVFVALAAVGDRLEVRLREIKGRSAFAEIERIIEPGPQRIVPPCPYVGRCGGCDFQQMTYAAQLDAKVGIIRDNLHRIGKIDYQNEIHVVGSPKEFGYRLRAQWHIDGVRREIGYYERNSRNLVAIEHCPILVEELDDELQRVRASADWTSFWPDKGSIDVACGSNGQVSAYSPELELGNNEIQINAAGETYTFNAKSFFQGNGYLIDSLVDVALGAVSGETALDLYSGVGLFTLPLARRFGRVTAVEDFPLAVEFAKRNIDDANLTNVEIVTQPVGRFLAAQSSREIDFALLDPPRFGTEKKTVLDLIRLRPKTVSYVSCDPSVLARDLRRFLDGGYEIQSITAIDLFPQTHHVETVVRLVTV